MTHKGYGEYFCTNIQTLYHQQHWIGNISKCLGNINNSDFFREHSFFECKISFVSDKGFNGILKAIAD